MHAISSTSTRPSHRRHGKGEGPEPRRELRAGAGSLVRLRRAVRPRSRTRSGRRRRRRADGPISPRTVHEPRRRPDRAIAATRPSSPAGARPGSRSRPPRTILCVEVVVPPPDRLVCGRSSVSTRRTWSRAPRRSATFEEPRSSLTRTAARIFAPRHPATKRPPSAASPSRSVSRSPISRWRPSPPSRSAVRRGASPEQGRGRCSSPAGARYTSRTGSHRLLRPPRSSRFRSPTVRKPRPPREGGYDDHVMGTSFDEGCSSGTALDTVVATLVRARSRSRSRSRSARRVEFDPQPSKPSNLACFSRPSVLLGPPTGLER